MEGRVEVEGKQSGINKSEWKWKGSRVELINQSGSGREAEWK